MINWKEHKIYIIMLFFNVLYVMFFLWISANFN